MTSLLEVRDVHAGYDRIEVLRGVSLTVPEGAIVALLGPNGSGKTTAVRAIAGELGVRAGEILLAGRRVTGLPAYRIARLGVAVVPERGGVFPGLSVAENLEIGARAASPRRRPAERADAVRALLDRFPALRDRLSHRAGTLSGGEQQMLALSRALLSSPRLLVLDEVSAGLAPGVVRRLIDAIEHARRAGITVLVAEQFAEYVLDAADVCYVLARGHVAAVCEPVEIKADPELLLRIE